LFVSISIGQIKISKDVLKDKIKGGWRVKLLDVLSAGQLNLEIVLLLYMIINQFHGMTDI
jgi:hypothetical protein